MAELRQRRPQHETHIQNGDVKQPRNISPEFVVRESPLTVLIGNSRHIKAIYHIFVAILLILLADTVVYDLVEKGKVNLGLTTIADGFGDIRRGAKLWIYDFAVTLAFYPGLRVYAAGAKVFRTIPGLRQVWALFGATCLLLLMAALVAVPVWDLGREHLALGSSCSVTCEMFRLAMKIYAVAMVCIPRCHDDPKPLPTFKHYLYFLFAPTLVYRDHYPRTRKTRWGVVIFHCLEVAAIVLYNSFLWERFIMPYWSDYGKQPKVDAGTVVRNMFACVLPGVISYLCGFYLLMHAWLNAFAEMLTFGDRLFYEDWWTTSQYSRFFRSWNRVVHAWLRDHIYQAFSPYIGRTLAGWSVFLVSALAHELILALSFGYFYPVLMFEFVLVGLLIMPMTSTFGNRYPDTLNLLMWLGFFVGNGLLWSLYPMEHFARKNCPKSDGDSFFIPKSWSCPEIVLKPNWNFQNPF